METNGYSVAMGVQAYTKKKEHSPAMDIHAQIENLKENNLIIEDEEEAALILQRVSYYRLIKAYGPSFKVGKTGYYRRGTTFDQIYRVYVFDSHLRYLLIPYLQEIEITFRCQVSNYFCVKYGVLGYLDSLNFNENISYDDLEKLSKKIDQCLIQAKDSPIIKNFRKNYVDGEVPLYAAVEVFTFGTLAMFYQSMKKNDQKDIADIYGLTPKYLSSWIVSIGYVRNLCSHFNRLYNRQLVKKPKLFKKQDGEVNNGTLYAVLCCMRYLLKGSGAWPKFVQSLAELLDAYSDCVKPSGIGCIENGWKEKLLDQEEDYLVYKLFSALHL